MVGLALLLLSLVAVSTAETPSPLSDDELHALADFDPSHSQPDFYRGTDATGNAHSLLQHASLLHQQGQFDKAISNLKSVLKEEPQNTEAYRALAKCLEDQGKLELADKARTKANRIQNEQLGKKGLF